MITTLSGAWQSGQRLQRGSTNRLDPIYEAPRPVLGPYDLLMRELRRRAAHLTYVCGLAAVLSSCTTSVPDEVAPSPSESLPSTVDVLLIVNTVIDTSSVSQLIEKRIAGEPCRAGAEASVATGSQVVLKNEDAKTIGLSELSAGVLVPGAEIPANAVCKMTANVEVSSATLKGDFFVVQLGSNGLEYTITREEAEAGATIQVGQFYWH